VCKCVDHINDYSIAGKYNDYITELVANEYKKKSARMNADAEKSTKKVIKDLLVFYFKTASDDHISTTLCKSKLMEALPHLNSDLLDDDVYTEYILQIISEHKAKKLNRSMKTLQSGIDRGMKKQIKDLVVKYAKTSEIPKVTKSLCKAFLLTELKDNCGDISKYDELIKDVLATELDKKMGRQLNALKKVCDKKTKRRIRVAISTGMKTYDIFTKGHVMLPDEVTLDDREKHNSFISKVINRRQADFSGAISTRYRIHVRNAASANSHPSLAFGFLNVPSTHR